MLLPEPRLYNKRGPPQSPMMVTAQKLLAVDLTGTINAVFKDQGTVEEVECDPSVIMQLGKTLKQYITEQVVTQLLRIDRL